MKAPLKVKMHHSQAAALRHLASFRYRIRRFLRFSERVARSHGVTPQQHQLLLGIAGHTAQGWGTISELAEFLQARHNAVVGLVKRAEEKGLVRKVQGADDRRFVQVHLTRRGYVLLDRISRQNLAELAKLQLEITRSPKPPAARTRPRESAA
jgi:DNA-binding MarR family transcriptional regulator